MACQEEESEEEEMTIQTHADAWIGWHENGAGKLMFSVVDHNPGNLAHVYRIRVEIPAEVRDHYERRLPCLVLDKFSKPKGKCE